MSRRHKGLCYKRACEAGVTTARLPILRYVKLEASTVLTVNHVVQVCDTHTHTHTHTRTRNTCPRAHAEPRPRVHSFDLLDDCLANPLSHMLMRVCVCVCVCVCTQLLIEYHNRRDWASVLDDVLPKRKRADYNAAKSSGALSSEPAENDNEDAAANEETAAGDNAATVAAAGTQSENDASNAGNGDVNGHGPPQGEGGSGGGANGLTEIAEQGQQGAQGQGESGERAAKSARIE